MRYHIGPYRSIRDHTGPYGTVQDNSGLFHARVEKSVTDRQTHRLTGAISRGACAPKKGTDKNTKTLSDNVTS